MSDRSRSDRPSGSNRKEMIRQEMIQRRESLSSDACVQASAAVCLHFQELLKLLNLGRRPLKIGVYAAIRKEIDLSGIWKDDLELSFELYFPAICGRGPAARLVFGQLPSGSQPADFLIPGRFGISEPPVDSWLTEPPALDIILLPGLAFDRQGNRLGWGRAFYDRFLQTMPNRPILVGVGYSFQISPVRLPAEPTDYPVDWLLTPDGCQKAEF